MPLVGVVCPNSNKRDVEFCLHKCEKRCTPYPLALAILKNELENFHAGDVITITSLLGCMRQTFLERRYPFFGKLKHLWYSARGAWMHQLLDSLEGDPRWLTEERFYHKFGGIEVSGQIDAYSKIECKLYDYKTIRDRGVAHIVDNGPKPDHVAQTSAYKLMLVEKNYPVKETSVVYLSMSETYECKHVFTWTDEETDRFFTVKAKELNTSFVNNSIPAMPSPRPVWLCYEYCPVLELCTSLNQS
jgi:hypothetical protein